MSKPVEPGFTSARVAEVWDFLEAGRRQYELAWRDLEKSSLGGRNREPRWIEGLRYQGLRRGHRLPYRTALEIHDRLLNHPKAKDWRRGHPGQDYWAFGATEELLKSKNSRAIARVRKLELARAEVMAPITGWIAATALGPVPFFVARRDVEPFANEIAEQVVRVNGVPNRLRSDIAHYVAQWLIRTSTIRDAYEEGCESSSAWRWAWWVANSPRVSSDGRIDPIQLAAEEWG